MNRFNLILTIFCAFIFSVTIHQIGFADTCIQCHTELDDSPDSPAELLKRDIHHQRGLSCVDCHGGDATVGYKEDDPDLAMDPKKGYRGVPSTSEIPQFCGRCHSNIEYMKKYEPKLRVDQLQLYWTSIHGKKLKRGDKKVAQCVSCHGAHGILPANDTRSPVNPLNVPETCANCHSNKRYMSKYKIPTNQYDEFSQSAHGKLLLEEGDKSAPACNSCHGNHGATPPGLASISAACGECHGLNRDLFDASPHGEIWAELEYPQCIQCHNHHLILSPTDDQIGTGEHSLCTECHSEGDKGYEIAGQISTAIDSLKHMITHAEEVLAKAEIAGIDVDDAVFELGEAFNGLIEARNKIHSFSLTDVTEVTVAAMAKVDNAVSAGEKGLRDLRIRQLGLLISSIIIILLAILLYIKVRKLDRGKKTNS